MAITTNIKLDTTELRALVSKMQANRAAYAISRGLNDALRQGRTEALKQLTNRYNIARYELTGRNLLRMTSARSSNLSASIFADAKRSVSISKFRGLRGDGLKVSRKRSKLEKGKINTYLKKGRKFQNSVTRSKPRQAVSFEIIKGKRQTLKSGFIAQVKAGKNGIHTGVFSRSRSSRGYVGGSFQYREGKGSRTKQDGNDTPIAEHYTFTLHKAMANRYTRGPIDKRMITAAPRRVSYWLNKELKK
jgi:hypothetical protein